MSDMLVPTLDNVLQKELTDCESVLDLGCGKGLRSLSRKKRSSTVGVDLFIPYVNHARNNKIYGEIVLGDITKIEFKPKSFDCVIAIDVIEHLTKEEGQRLLQKMEHIAKKKVIILTPNHFNIKQHLEDNNMWQAHKSGWNANEFQSMGFDVKGMDGLRILRSEHARLNYKPQWLWWVISDTSEIFTHKAPGYAFRILCIKRMSKMIQ